MQCPNCKLKMEKGTLIGEGGWWRGEGITTEFKKIIRGPFVMAVSVFAFHCSKCGKIELTTKAD